MLRTFVPTLGALDLHSLRDGHGVAVREHIADDVTNDSLGSGRVLLSFCSRASDPLVRAQ